MDYNDLSFSFEKSCIKINNDEFKIYAHKNELLNEHIIKTQYIFHSLLDEDIFLNFYNYFYENNFIRLSYSEFKEIIDIFILFHDIGKISPNFQINKLNKNNPQIRKSQINILENNNLNELRDSFVSYHSFTSALSFLVKFKEIFYENKLFFNCLSYTINGHHTNLKDILMGEEFAYNYDFNSYLLSVNYLILFLDIANINEINQMKFNQSFFQDMQDLAASCKTSKDSTFSFFYNYMYSLLISSDVFASNEYYKSIDKVKEIRFNNRISNFLKNKIIDAFYNVEYNKNLKNERFLKNISEFEDINSIRKNMLLESSFNLIKNINLNSKTKIFYLNMPTGGGKTNTSMKLALDLIENTDVNRIIYAMPFINIIEQNYDVIKENFGLDEENGEIRKIYSATETIFNERSDEFKSKVILQDSFFNYPVICTTFSTFFDGILRTNKRYKYKISSYVNSVVILDEIQSLHIKNWNSLYYIINEIAEKYNIYFIIMSATLPKFDKLKVDYENKFEHKKPVQLINCPERYFNHYLFDRTEIKNNIEEVNLNKKSELNDYFFKVIEENFKNGFNKGLIVLNTIKSSKLIYNLLNEMDIPNLTVDLLNSSLLFNVKKEIIYKINNMVKNKSEKYILVSTQSIEAGVDVSFDFVIRDFAILDSIEQVRGRCNRSRELNENDPYKKGNIYLINLKDKQNYLYEYIYNEHEINSRILETHNILNDEINYDYEDIIRYYNNVSDSLNLLEDKKEENFIINDRENILNWNNMVYSKLQDKLYGIHIIDNNLNQYSLYIPTQLYIFTENLDKIMNFENNFNDFKEFYENNKEKFIFSYNELEFLKTKQKGSQYKFIKENFVDGDELIKFYKEYIDDIDKMDFDRFKIIKKEFSSIINKFIINFTLNDDELESKILDEDEGDFEKLSYFYIMDKKLIGDDEYSLYSIENGLNYNFCNVELL